MAGATAVQIGAMNLTDKKKKKNIIEKLPDVMSELKINSLTDIIGIINK